MTPWPLIQTNESKANYYIPYFASIWGTNVWVVECNCEEVINIFVNLDTHNNVMIDF